MLRHKDKQPTHGLKVGDVDGLSVGLIVGEIVLRKRNHSTLGISTLEPIEGSKSHSLTYGLRVGYRVGPSDGTLLGYCR